MGVHLGWVRDREADFQFLSGFQYAPSSIHVFYASSTFNSFPDSRGIISPESVGWPLSMLFQFLSGFQEGRRVASGDSLWFAFQFLSGFQRRKPEPTEVNDKMTFQFLSGFQRNEVNRVNEVNLVNFQFLSGFQFLFGDAGAHGHHTALSIPFRIPVRARHQRYRGQAEAFQFLSGFQG